MRVIVQFELNAEEIDIDEGHMPLSPREVGALISWFRGAMNIYGEVRNFEVILPYTDDDTEDIKDVITTRHEGIEVHLTDEPESLLNTRRTLRT